MDRSKDNKKKHKQEKIAAVVKKLTFILALENKRNIGMCSSNTSLHNYDFSCCVWSDDEWSSFLDTHTHTHTKKTKEKKMRKKRSASISPILFCPPLIYISLSLSLSLSYLSYLSIYLSLSSSVLHPSSAAKQNERQLLGLRKKKLVRDWKKKTIEDVRC